MGRTKQRLAQVAIVTTVTAGGVGAMTAAPASAAAVTCTISSITPATPGTYYINFNCRKGAVNPPDFAYDVEIWGEDTFSDDYRRTNFLNGLNVGSPTPTHVSGSTLNEDYGDKDDIYIKVKFRTSTGAKYTVRSNTIHGWWS